MKENIKRILTLALVAGCVILGVANSKLKQEVGMAQADVRTAYMYGWFKGAERGVEIVKFKVDDSYLIIRRAKLDSIEFVNHYHKLLDEKD